MSPRHQRRSMPASSIAASTASRAGRLAWMSVTMATRTGGGNRGRGPPEEAVYRRPMGAGSSSKWLRLGATAVAAVGVAEAAAWLLRPRDVVEPAQVDESAYFPKEEIARARDYASGQRLLLVGSLVAEGAVLVLLAPLFNKFDPLEPGQPRDDVIELADRAGVDVGEVYRVDASRRTTAINAYVNGLGPSKRVVLY